MLIKFGSPASVSSLSKAKHAGKENGVGPGELDEASARRAEARYLKYYQLHGEGAVDAAGTVPFS